MTRKQPLLPILIALFLLYWFVSLRHLTIVPPVYEDEPWQAATGWKLATEGIFGADLFAGYHGMERHYYGYMPVHPMLLAVTFRLAGLGLFQDRFETVVMGLFILSLSYALGRRLASPHVGLLTVVLLSLVRITGTTPSQLTGIPLIDMARIARYDMVTALFGLAALLAYLSAGRTLDAPPSSSWRWLALSGLLAALAGLSHLYGLFWLMALAGLSLWDRLGWRKLAVLAAAFALPWLPYLIYIGSGWSDWLGQTAGYAPRFELLNARWYWQNLLSERHRYWPGLGSPGWGYLLRPGFWAALVTVPLSLIWLAYRAMAAKERAARILLVPAVLLPLLFALLIHLKLANYLITIVPLWATAVAWSGVTLWRWSARASSRRWLRLLLAALVVAVAAEGLSRTVILQKAAATTTPYNVFIANVRAHIAPGSRVLGLHNYWLGLDDFDYRSWAVVWPQGDSSDQDSARLIYAALDGFSPDIMLLDPRIRTAFAEHPAVYEGVQVWLADNHFKRLALIEDSTYGSMEIYGAGP